MDQIAIGRFIKMLRTERRMTQRELAEKLNVSAKAVSKWETGNGLPEVSLMLPLCALLSVGVNELLSGQRLDDGQYEEKAEENIKTAGEAEELLLGEYVEKFVLRHFKPDAQDVNLLQKFYCPELPRAAIAGMIGDWNTLSYQGKYFEMFAVVRDKKAVGTLSLYEHSRSVVSVGVEIFAGERRRGNGTAAMKKAIELCRKKGYKILAHQVRTDNAASMRLHEKVGFETDRYVYKNQRGHDVYLYLKPL